VDVADVADGVTAGSDPADGAELAAAVVVVTTELGATDGAVAGWRFESEQPLTSTTADNATTTPGVTRTPAR
jgi:hypothetical protein